MRARQGGFVTPYTYASANPINRVDRKGKWDMGGGVGSSGGSILGDLGGALSVIGFLIPSNLFQNYDEGPNFTPGPGPNFTPGPAPGPNFTPNNPCGSPAPQKPKAPCRFTGQMNSGQCSYLCADGSRIYIDPGPAGNCNPNPQWPS